MEDNYYKKLKSFNQRKVESLEFFHNNLLKIPIIFQYENDNSYIKFKVHRNQRVSSIIKNLKLHTKQDQSIFLYVLLRNKKIILNLNDSFHNIYNKYFDLDGYLYIFYTKLSYFGHHII